MTALIHGLGAGLIGKDPREIARIEAALYATSRPTAGGLSCHAIGAIVNACLDIKGKALGLPVYELLGGARARADGGVLVALRGVAGALRRAVRRQGDRPAGRSLRR